MLVNCVKDIYSYKTNSMKSLYTKGFKQHFPLIGLLITAIVFSIIFLIIVHQNNPSRYRLITLFLNFYNCVLLINNCCIVHLIQSFIPTVMTEQYVNTSFMLYILSITIANYLGVFEYNTVCNGEYSIIQILSIVLYISYYICIGIRLVPWCITAVYQW